MSKMTELFGSMVFDESTMKERLPKETFKQLQRTIKLGKSLDINIANVVANAMKDWALEQGCDALHPLVPTHDRHGPRKSTTAFISPYTLTAQGDLHGILRQRAGAAANRTPPLSLPGVCVATFEARGYTAWDPNLLRLSSRMPGSSAFPLLYLQLRRSRRLDMKDAAAALHGSH